MRAIGTSAAGALMLSLGACAGGGLFGGGDGYGRYDYNRPDPRYGGYDAGRYYRPGAEQRLGSNDRVYRGADGRYYCRRSNGTTGLLVGALGGGVLGNVIAPGGSQTLGTLIGAGAGAVIGRAIEQGQASCR